MTDQNSKAPEQSKPKEEAPKKFSHLERLQKLEVEGRKLIDDIKLELAHTDKGSTDDLEAAALRLSQFVRALTLHIQKPVKTAA